MVQTANTINAHTHLFGIYGNPVRHSLSPVIHNAVFQRLKMKAVYLAFEIEKDNLRFAFESMRALGIRGVNVTIPFKESALEFLDEVPEDRLSDETSLTVRQRHHHVAFRSIPQTDKAESHLDINTFSSLRKRDGYPKERKLSR